MLLSWCQDKSEYQPCHGVTGTGSPNHGPQCPLIRSWNREAGENDTLAQENGCQLPPLEPAKALSQAPIPHTSLLFSLLLAPSHIVTYEGLSPPLQTGPYLRVALSPCRTVTLSIALGKVASPLRTGTPVGTRNSSLRDTTTRHFQGRNRYPQTPILDSHNFPERRQRHGPCPLPHTPAGLRKWCGREEGME